MLFNEEVARSLLRAATGFAALLATSATDAQDIEAGKAQFLTSCGVCHAIDPAAPPRQGPPLAGIFGRRAGQHTTFKYSPTMKSADWIWDEAHLDPWIENAQGAHPGTIMNYRQADPEKRARVIAYLKTLTQP